MTARVRRITAMIAIAIACPVLAAAQTTAKASQKIKLVTLDLAVPDSPAFAILGLSPESIVRPNSPRELATTVLNGLDRRGNLQSGLAVDFAPRLLFGGNSLTFKDYTTKRGERLSARTQVSVATAKGTGDGDKSMRVAFGGRASLWDRGDPRMDADLVNCMDAVITPPPAVALLTQAQRDAYEKSATAARRPGIEACHTAHAKRNWNASSFAVGAAPSWQSLTGESGDLEYAGTGLWAALSVALSTPAPSASEKGQAIGQLIVQGRYRDREQVPSKVTKGTFFEQDSAGIGTRLLLGVQDRAAVVEAEWVRQEPSGADATTVFKLSGGGQLKLAANVWLSVAVGGQTSGNSDEQRGTFVLSSFKWALSREPSVTAP